jgi:hypothetical protein
MIGKFIAKGLPKCSTCIYHRTENNIIMCVKFLGAKPIEADIARHNDLMCGYSGTQHKPCELLVVNNKKHLIDSVVMQPHI